MKLFKRKLFSRVFVLTCVLSTLVQSAYAKDKSIPCPIVADRENGTYSSSRAKYKCYEDSRSARQSGYEKHSFSDDDCSPGGGDGDGGDADLNLTGPGESKSVVFAAPSGGSVSYTFPGGGEFEIDVYAAQSERRIQRLLETSGAASGVLPFTAQENPIFIKVEGPGAWTAGIEIN